MVIIIIVNLNDFYIKLNTTLTVKLFLKLVDSEIAFLDPKSI